jgi:hypothetical protein
MTRQNLDMLQNSSPDSPFEDTLSLPEYSPADSRQLKLYINLVTSDSSGIPFIEGYYLGIQASTGHISAGLKDHRFFAVDNDQHEAIEELVISAKVLAMARMKDSVTLVGLLLLEVSALCHSYSCLPKLSITAG